MRSGFYVDKGQAEAYTNRLIRRLQKKSDEACEKAKRDIFPYYKQTLETLYKEEVERFYDDYDPEVYDRKNSLYNALVFDGDSNSGEAKGVFDDDYITPTRSGDHAYIYKWVFEEGFHGGPVWPWFDPPKTADSTESPLHGMQRRWPEIRDKDILPKMYELYFKYFRGGR